MNMGIEIVEGRFSVCKVDSVVDIDMHSRLFFIGKTDSETSLVCPEGDVPDKVIERDDGWNMFRFTGQLDFSLIGILSKVSTLMADNGIGIFAVSTCDTDYILIKEKDFQRALTILKDAGYRITSSD